MITINSDNELAATGYMRPWSNAWYVWECVRGERLLENGINISGRDWKQRVKSDCDKNDFEYHGARFKLRERACRAPLLSTDAPLAAPGGVQHRDGY